MIPKEYMNQQKVTNATNLIGQSEPSATKLIIVHDKMRFAVSILSGRMGASVTPEKLFHEIK